MSKLKSQNHNLNFKSDSHVTVSAPGKLHLLGEHAVVYGKPAIIAAVNRRCTATLVIPSDPAQRGESRDPFTTEDDYIDLCFKQALDFFKKRKSSWWTKVEIQSNIPLGSGMGSSAAVAVAIAGAVSKLLTGKIIKEQINKIAFNCEKYMHGNPSGGDNTTCTYGGLIWYQKSIPRLLPFSLPEKISSKFFIINTGKPEESTKEMVELVATRNQELRTKKVFDDQEKLVYELLTALENGDEKQTADIIKAGEENLEKLGIVSESTKRLIRKIEATGGAAKICGAGGRKKASGIVLVFHNDFKEIAHIAKQFKLQCEKIRLGEEGVREEL